MTYLVWKENSKSSYKNDEILFQGSKFKSLKFYRGIKLELRKNIYYGYWVKNKVM